MSEEIKNNFEDEMNDFKASSLPPEEEIPVEEKYIEEKADAFGEEIEETIENAFGELGQIDREIEKEKEEARSTGYGQSIFWGMVLIIVGAILILQRTNMLGTDFNWWALFIFIPAFGALSTTWNILLKKRRITSGVRSSFGSFVTIGTLATMFLFDMDWSIWWPLMMIAPGFSIFLNGFVDRKSKAGTAGHWFGRMGWWIGISVIGLGAAFLGQNLRLFSMVEVTGFRHWWALFLLLPGVTFLLHALITVVITHRFPFGSVTQIITGVASLSVAVVALFELEWSLITPVAAVGAGIAIILSEMLRKTLRPKQVKSETISKIDYQK